MSDDGAMRAFERANRRIGMTEAKEVPLIARGTYSPTYLGSATPGTTTYTAQVGRWTKIEDLIFVQGQVAWSAATGTGNAQIGLPFAAVGNGSGSLRIINVTFANGTPQMLISSGNSFFTMDSPLTNAGSTTVAIEAAGNVVFSAWYFIA